MRRPSRSAPRHFEREELRVESLAVGGAGVAKRRDGSVVFVTGVGAGELVRVEIDPRSRPARGRLLEVIEPSAERVRPVCPFVDRCGGCDWMHLSLSAQQRAHAELVRGAIVHATGTPDVPEVVVHAAPVALGYRTRARLLARADRGRVRVGFRAAASHELAEVDTCAVLDPVIDGVIRRIPEVLAGGSGDGEVLLARGAGGLPVVDLRWRGEIAAASWTALDAFVGGGRWAGARVLLDGVTAPATFGDPRPRMTGADGLPLVVAAGSFSQTSDEGAALLARRVAELALAGEGRGGAEGRHVLELFAGSGTLSVLLARGAGLTAVEVDAAAAACARENLAARADAGVGSSWSVTVADADTRPIPPRADVIVLDPPRSGAPGAARAIAASRVRRVVYVACDPATLARDLGTLTRSGLGICGIETFELFPQTSHVETVVSLARSPP